MWVSVCVYLQTCVCVCILFTIFSMNQMNKVNPVETVSHTIVDSETDQTLSILIYESRGTSTTEIHCSFNSGHLNTVCATFISNANILVVFISQGHGRCESAIKASI